MWTFLATLATFGASHYCARENTITRRTGSPEEVAVAKNARVFSFALRNLQRYQIIHLDRMVQFIQILENIMQLLKYCHTSAVPY